MAGLVTAWLEGTKAPIKDGFNGAGVYAGRLRSTGSACGFQSPEVLGYRWCLDDFLNGERLDGVCLLKGFVHG